MPNPLNLFLSRSLEIGSVALVTALFTLPASAATYTAYPGSSVILKTVSGKMTGPSNNISYTMVYGGSESIPLLGGLITQNGQAGYACALAAEISTRDKFRGIQANSNGIIAGVTGTILNGVASYLPPGAQSRTTITGGLVFDSFGVATPVGDAQPYYATRLCAAVALELGTRLSTPGNTAWGNKFADFDVTTWLYVPVNIAPGTYSLKGVSLVQGSAQYQSTAYTSYIRIISTGETVEVLAPPCTISAQTNIVFDTTSEEGMKVNAPVTFQCNELGTPTALEAFLQVRPVSSIASNTELKMTINGSQPGGVIRGYAGQDLDTSNVNCLDNTHSISFNQAFGPRLGAMVSNNNQQIPLVWQLCRKGNEVPGLATGSATLIMNYK